MSQPTCTVIAGPNGAVKTTFALSYLKKVAQNHHFVNADLIANGLDPITPAPNLIAAGRICLEQRNIYMQRRENFAFETTLAGKHYLRLIERLRIDGWWVQLFYLWLPSVEMSAARVAGRVAHGGHDIAHGTLVRRYPRSIYNLLHHYAPRVDSVVCLDNSSDVPQVIFT